jgi:tRNA(Leu) C34 or U34 (ribose-2'-O)-methylase TrmL
VVTAFSISAKELLRQSPDLYALLLLQQLPQLEDLRKKANSEGESTNIFSTTSTTSPSQAKMERNH